MNIYLISQEKNIGYETYDYAVVCAPDEWTARNMSPRDGEIMGEEDWNGIRPSWCLSTDDVEVKLLGKAEDALDQGLVLASFNAG